MQQKFGTFPTAAIFSPEVNLPTDYGFFPPPLVFLEKGGHRSSEDNTDRSGHTGHERVNFLLAVQRTASRQIAATRELIVGQQMD
jgi:hypothetical protein